MQVDLDITKPKNVNRVDDLKPLAEAPTLLLTVLKNVRPTVTPSNTRPLPTITQPHLRLIHQARAAHRGLPDPPITQKYVCQAVLPRATPHIHFPHNQAAGQVLLQAIILLRSAHQVARPETIPPAPLPHHLRPALHIPLAADLTILIPALAHALRLRLPLMATNPLPAFIPFLKSHAPLPSTRSRKRTAS